MAGTQPPTDPQVLAAASKCPYIQQVVTEVGDAQMVSNSLGPFLALVSAARAAGGLQATASTAPGAGAAAAGAADATSKGTTGTSGTVGNEFGSKNDKPTEAQADAAAEAATAI